jgi:quercetin dioxygenase-like cupin family protein
MKMRTPKGLLAAALSSIALLTIALPTALAEDAKPAKITQVFGEKLPNVPGNSITGILVEYEPGGKTAAHRHAGSVMAYVLSGAIRSENSATGPVRVYKAGESFFEPAGSIHLVSENASATEPASLLAIFIAEDGATLTMPGK